MTAMKNMKIILTLLLCGLFFAAPAQKKAVFIILDGIPADVIEVTPTPVLDEIAEQGGYTRAWLGGMKNGYSQSPTISAVGYNSLLTGTWTNKHNVHDNAIKAPNYHYWNIFRIAENDNSDLKTAIFSSWTDNRTKLVGESLPQAGNLKLDYSFDGLELDTVSFPHTADRTFMFEIDEAVSKEAGRYIRENGPDLSWVYLEFTDDMGHMYGDSPQLTDAVKKADAQVGRIWKAIQDRESKFGEEWMIVITTDHGRDAETGKNHGGQSDRERTIWITTNAKGLNGHFRNMPAIVDIAPSILRFMEINVPEETQREMDGIPFIGELSFTGLKAQRKGKDVILSWVPVHPNETVEIYLATTNHFGKGKTDKYKRIARAPVSKRKFTFEPPDSPSGLYKIVVKGRHNLMNTWVVGEIRK